MSPGTRVPKTIFGGLMCVRVKIITKTWNLSKHLIMHVLTKERNYINGNIVEKEKNWKLKT